METKDIRELKKTLTVDNSTATEIRCCYISVTDEGPLIKSSETKRIAGMERTELLKYFALFGKIFGTVDKKVFERQIEGSDAQRLLQDMASSGLRDETVESLFREIALRHKKGENIAVFIMRGVYDVPVKTLDNIRNDESDIAYPHIICAVCPSRLTGAGLSYDQEAESFSTLDLQHEIKPPVTGFIYPSLTDREPDFDNGMIYTANEKAVEDNIFVSLFGCEAPSVPKPEKKKPQPPVIDDEQNGNVRISLRLPDYDETAFPRREEQSSVSGDGVTASEVTGSEGGMVDSVYGGEIPFDGGTTIDDFQDYGIKAGDQEGAFGRSYGSGPQGAAAGTRDENEPSVNEVISGGVQHKKRFTKWASDGSAELTVPVPGAARMLAMYEDLGTIEELRRLIETQRR